MIDRRFRPVLARSGVFNARDLGGLPARNGQVVASGLLVRADALHRCEPAAGQGLADRGTTLVMDLRDAAEQEATAVFSHADITTEHHPVLDSAWSWEDHSHEDPSTLLEHRYRSILTEFGGRLAQIVQRVADHDGGVAYHCAVGKDRTGLLTMLLLGALGVSAEHIVADYALTSRVTAIQVGYLWIMGRVEGDVSDDELRIGLWSARPVTMANTLKFVDDEFGGITEYLAEHGAGTATVEALSARLLA